jgi:hypothetical protein
MGESRGMGIDPTKSFNWLHVEANAEVGRGASNGARPADLPFSLTYNR